MITREAVDDPLASFVLAAKLPADLAVAAEKMEAEQVRLLVDFYYAAQNHRVRLQARSRAFEQSDRPHEVVDVFLRVWQRLERKMAQVLQAWARKTPIASRAMTVKGVGPIIAAGLAAHIDLTKAKTPSAIWRFAGLDPTCVWQKNQKRPWNAALKVLCWKLGESFVKVSGHEDAVYGKLYLQRKRLEAERNESGAYAEQAANCAKRVGKNTIAYKHYSAGKLPPAHIHARAKRWVVKLFLAHYWENGREMLGLPTRAPYPTEKLGHTSIIKPSW